MKKTLETLALPGWTLVRGSHPPGALRSQASREGQGITLESPLWRSEGRKR